VCRSFRNKGWATNAFSMKILQNLDTSWPNWPWPSKQAITRDDVATSFCIRNESWFLLVGLLGAAHDAGKARQGRAGERMNVGDMVCQGMWNGIEISQSGN
jgi:hypothetical protein